MNKKVEAALNAQIEKELDYAETLHPDQELSREHTISLVLNKLRYERCCGKPCEICTDDNKFLCSVYSSIAILIRSLECEHKRQLEKVQENLYSNRNRVFNETKDKRYGAHVIR